MANKSYIMDTLNGKIILTLPYRGEITLQGYHHPSILILEDGRVVMPILKIENDGEITMRKFGVLGKLLPALEDGTQLFVNPTQLGRQLEINLSAIALRLKEYRWEGGKLVNAAKTANKALVINIAL